MTKKPEGMDLKERWGPIVDCIADLLGPNAEVVLHDVRHTDHSIVMIRNGSVTGRTVGAPLTDLGFFMLRESERKIQTLGVYQGNIEGILCINIDVGTQEKNYNRTNDGQVTEHYWTKPAKVIENMVSDACQGTLRANGDLTREQKLELIQALDARGVFLARNAVKNVSATLNIAIPTVYKYIRMVRNRGAGIGS